MQTKQSRKSVYYPSVINRDIYYFSAPITLVPDFFAPLFKEVKPVHRCRIKR